MTLELFQNALTKWNKKLSTKQKKIVLFEDICTAHPLMPHLLNIKLVFLTPNTTLITQPMDQGVIKCLKSAYRKLLVKKMMTHMEEAPEKPFPINILDAIVLVLGKLGKQRLLKQFQNVSSMLVSK